MKLCTVPENDYTIYLKIVECPRRYVVIELPHHVPWSITNPNKHN